MFGPAQQSTWARPPAGVSAQGHDVECSTFASSRRDQFADCVFSRPSLSLVVFFFLSFWSGYEKRKNNKAFFVPYFFPSTSHAQTTYLYTDNKFARQTFEQQEKNKIGAPFISGPPSTTYCLPCHFPTNVRGGATTSDEHSSAYLFHLLATQQVSSTLSCRPYCCRLAVVVAKLKTIKRP